MFVRKKSFLLAYIISTRTSNHSREKTKYILEVITPYINCDSVSFINGATSSKYS
jgi:hypothetical protein